MQLPSGKANRPSGVLAGSRVRRLPRLIALVLAAFVAVEALLLGMGLTVTRALDDTELHAEELELTRAVLETRTPTWDGITTWGTVLGSTWVVIGLTAVAASCCCIVATGPGCRRSSPWPWRGRPGCSSWPHS